jgi:hypothetical protein
VDIGVSVRGVAENYLVLPEGSELTGSLDVIWAGTSLDHQTLTFGDLALFELAGRHAFARRFEVSGTVDFLPKQPAYTDEKVWQSAGIGARAALASNVAASVGGAVGRILDHDGEWLRERATVEWKHPLSQWVAFDLQGGADTIELVAPGAMGAQLTELGVQASTFMRGNEQWGMWVGIAYAVPVEHSGEDPTTGMAIAPKPRLDLHIGTVLAVVPEWDLFVDAAVITRGSIQDPATTLPILDGGFDQRQLVIGVTRHFGNNDNGRHVNEPLKLSGGG